MKLKICLSLLLGVILCFGNFIYFQAQGVIEGSAAVNQVDDSAVSYTVSRAISGGSFYHFFVIAMILLLFLVWIFPTSKKEN